MSHRHKRTLNPITSISQYMLLISIFHLGQPIDCGVLYFLRHIFKFPGFLTVLAVTSSYGALTFSNVLPFFQNIFPIFRGKVALIVLCLFLIVLCLSVLCQNVSSLQVGSCTSKMPAAIFKDGSGSRAQFPGWQAF